MRNGCSSRRVDGCLAELIGRALYKYFPAILIGAALMVVTGCSTVGKPSPDAVKAIQTGHKSIALIRVTETTEKNGRTDRIGIPFESYVVPLGRPGDAQRLDSNASFSSWIAPSAAAGKEGWQYLVLDPGNYYVELMPNVPAVKMNTNFIRYLSIPDGKSIVYAGSFCFNRQPIKRSAWGKIEDMGLTYYAMENDGVRDESVEARQIVNTSLADLGDVSTILAVSYNDLSDVARGIANRRIARIQVGSSTLKTGDAGTDRDLVVAAPFVAPGMLALGASRKTSGEAADDDQLLGVGLLIAASPFVAVADNTVGNAARKKWAPYAAELKNEFVRFHLEEHLQKGIGNRFPSALQGPGGANHMGAGSGLVVQIQPYRVALQESGFGKFALEIALKVKLFDPVQKRNLWEHDYVYTDLKTAEKKLAADAELEEENSIFMPASYETLIHPSSTPYSLDDYEGAAGVERFHRELSVANTIISDDIASRFIAAGFY